MKIRYFETRAVKRRLRKQKTKAYWKSEQKRIAKWHKKFVWWPKKMTTTDDYVTVVIFECIMQKAFIKDMEYSSLRKIVWTRHTEKEYFRKKLDGTLEHEQAFTDNSGDTAMHNTSYTGTQNAGIHKLPMAQHVPGKLSGPTGGTK